MKEEILTVLAITLILFSLLSLFLIAYNAGYYDGLNECEKIINTSLYNIRCNLNYSINISEHDWLHNEK